MAEVRFPSGSIITLAEIGPEDNITLSDFGGSQQEREGRFRLAIAYRQLHKRKLLEEPDYDSTDPQGATSGIAVTADEYRQAIGTLDTIPIPESDDETFVSLHLDQSVPEIAAVADEESPHFRRLLRDARTWINT
jgi:hypothetical protein